VAEIERQYFLQEIIDFGYIRLSERKLRAIVQEMGFQPSPTVGKYCFTASQVREIQEYVDGAKRQTGEQTAKILGLLTAPG
tara:strand:+ start:699 stop:941 length:243 start_codon:yes stop_codon:yes gene_type:complete